MRNFLTIVFSCLFLSTIVSPVLAGQTGSKKSRHNKESKSNTENNYASLVESEIQKLAKKSKMFFVENNINTLKERYAYFQVLASITRAMHHASVGVETYMCLTRSCTICASPADSDYFAAYEAFDIVADAVGEGSYFDTWNRIMDNALAAKELAADASAKAYKKAIKRGASESEAKKLSNHVAILKMLEYFNNTFRFEDAYAAALANFHNPLDFFDGVWTPSRQPEFLNLPQGAQVFLPLIEAFDPEVVSFSDQAVTFMGGYGDQSSVVNTLPIEVLSLVVLSLASLQNQVNSH